MPAPSGADVHGGLWHQYKEKAWEEAELESADGFGLNLDAGRESKMEGHSGKKDACLLGLDAKPQWREVLSVGQNGIESLQRVARVSHCGSFFFFFAIFFY